MNSGRYTGKKDPEKTILKTNVEAAREVARQLRLRDIGGIIVCDFIDMETKANRDKVLQELRTHLGRDRARTKAFAVSDLGLVEMTRQRVRQSHLQNMTEPCQTCHGTGRVFTAETIVRRLERSVRRMGVEGKRDHLVVKLHPDVAMYVLEHEKDLLKKLEKLAGFGLELRDDPLLRPDEFKLVVKSAGRDVTPSFKFTGSTYLALSCLTPSSKPAASSFVSSRARHIAFRRSSAMRAATSYSRKFSLAPTATTSALACPS